MVSLRETFDFCPTQLDGKLVIDVNEFVELGEMPRFMRSAADAAASNAHAFHFRFYFKIQNSQI